MTNPYQQQPHGSASFAGGDSVPAGGLPPLNVRRPSYASVVSGSPSALARPARSGFSHILNPSDDSDPQAHASNPYSSTQSHRFDPGAPHVRNGAATDEDVIRWHVENSPWAPRHGSSFPYFSRAFDLYMNKDPLSLSSTSSAGGGPDDRTSFPSASAMPNISATGFLAPSYLRGTIYLQKLEERHRARLLAEQRQASAGGHAPSTASASRLASNGSAAHLPSAGGFGAGGSSSSLAKMASSGGHHRGVAYDVVEKSHHHHHAGSSAAGAWAWASGGQHAEDGFFEDDDGGGGGGAFGPLPSRWNREDKEAALEVLGEGYEVRHTGRASSEHEASAVRADHAVAPACGVYYFEITVLHKRKDQIKTPPIAIGFASKEASVTRAPGWEPDSWGYHGDDGNSFASQNVGKPYAAQFGAGDTVGCLINFRLNHALFTKNGQELPIAFKDIPFKDIKGKIYPIVGLKKKEDHIMANFGQRPFMYDIDGYMREQRQQAIIEEEIRHADTSRLVPGLSETDLIQQLVLQFLQHDGYVETARAFAEELHAEKSALRLDPDEPVKGISIRDDEDANNRQRIRRSILEGDIDRAMNDTNRHYPTVLRDNEQVYFRLRCRKFIEMVRKEAELNMLLEERRAAAAAKRQQQHQQQHPDDNDEEMLEAEPAAQHQSSSNGYYNDNGIERDDMGDTAMGEGGAGGSDAAIAALAYGLELRAEFNNDPRRETESKLDEIFGLLAYPNPLKVKEVAHLLDGSGRVAVAEELNSAILTSLGKSSRAALENVYAQTSVLLEDLRRDGGDGAFVTVQSVVERIPPSRVC